MSQQDQPTVDPGYDPYDNEVVEAMLKEHGVTMMWDEYTGKLAARQRAAQLPDGEWRMVWSKGTMTFGGRKDNEKHARHMVALFIHLWNKGIDVGLARDLSVCYWKHVLPI